MAVVGGKGKGRRVAWLPRCVVFCLYESPTLFPSVVVVVACCLWTKKEDYNLIKWSLNRELNGCGMDPTE